MYEVTEEKPLNRRESDLIAEALHEAMPAPGDSSPRYGAWHNTVNCVKNALLAKGHISDEARFMGIVSKGVNWKVGGQ